MIKFKRIVVRDTFAYRNLDFKFEQGIHRIAGKNGSSKTSIFLALMQGLFNKNAKSMKIDEVNNKVTGQPYEIEIWFDKRGKEYWVKNSKKTGKIEITEDGKEIHLKRIPDNLKLIEDILGCDYQMFCGLAYQSPESSINLLETTSDGERKKFINRINRLDELDYHHERMKGKEKELAGKGGTLSSLDRQIQTCEGSLTELQEELEEIDTKPLEDKVKEIGEYVGNLRNEHLLLKVRRDDLQKKLDLCKENSDKVAELAQLECAVAAITPPEEAEEILAEKLSATRNLYIQNSSELKATTDLLRRAQEAEGVRRQISALDTQLRMIEVPSNPLEFVEDQLKKINNLRAASSTRNAGRVEEKSLLVQANQKGECPTCGHEVDHARFTSDISRLESEIEDTNALIKKCETSLEKYEAQKTCWKQVHELTAKINMLEAHPDLALSVSEYQGKVAALSEDSRSLSLEINSLESDLSSFRTYLELENKINSLRATIGPQDSLVDMSAELEAVDTHLRILIDSITSTGKDLVEAQVSLDKAKDHNALTRARRELNEKIRENNSKLQVQIDALMKEKQEAEEVHEYVKTWVGILGSKGYRVHKIKRFLKNINLTMEKYSSMISDNRIRCEFFIDEDGEIDFTVTDANKSISFSGWSNGEKARVKLSCLFAVLEILESLGTASFNILALDEIFGSLDDEGKEGLFKVLSYLQDKGKSIYTIAHSELVLPLTYDSEIRAEKLEDGTTIITQ